MVSFGSGEQQSDPGDLGDERVLVRQAPRPPEAARSTRHRPLVQAVGPSFHASDGTYGSPRVVVDLGEAGWQVSVTTVAAIMAEHGWVARPKRVRRSLTKQGKRPTRPVLGRGRGP